MTPVKKGPLIALFCLVTTNSFTQNPMYSYGATISVLSGAGIILSQTSVCYFPRYSFAEAENTSFSVGLPVALGIGIFNNAYGDAGTAFAYDIPAVLDYTTGCKSTPDIEATFGGYFGVGFGYYKINISKSPYSNFSGGTYGPMAKAGVRLMFCLICRKQTLQALHTTALHQLFFLSIPLFHSLFWCHQPF